MAWPQAAADVARFSGLHPLSDEHLKVLVAQLRFLEQGAHVEFFYLNDRSYGSAKGAFVSHDGNTVTVMTDGGRRRNAPLRMVFYASCHKDALNY